MDAKKGKIYRFGTAQVPGFSEKGKEPMVAQRGPGLPAEIVVQAVADI